jgi:cell division protein FtsQ
VILTAWLNPLKTFTNEKMIMKIARNAIVWILILTYLIVVSGFMSDKQSGQLINSIDIRILDADRSHFIDVDDVREILYSSRIPLLGEKCVKINLKSIEDKLRQQQIIRTAEAYITERGALHVDIRQREPFVRIFNRKGQSYYLDHEGNIIPVSRSFSPFVLVVNGYIYEPFSLRQIKNIWSLDYDSLSQRQQCIYDIFRLASFIDQDEFWTSQIQQVYVNETGEFELIPRVGSHVIEFGRIDNVEEKFYKLRLLYLQGFNQLGWNQYSRINLKYNNQVVCIKN